MNASRACHLPRRLARRYALILSLLVGLLPLAASIGSPGRSVMYRSQPDHVASYEAEPVVSEPQVVWRTRLAGNVFASPLVWEGKVFVGSGDNRFYAVDVDTGSVVWEYETLGSAHSSPALRDGVVYFGDFAGAFYALDASTGALKWRRQLLGERRWGTKGIAYQRSQEKYYQDDWDCFLSAPTIGEDRLYYASGNGNVYAFGLQDGETLWRFETNDVAHTSPALADGRLYVGSWDTFFYCLDADTGRLEWKLQTGVDTVNYNQTGLQSSPVVSDGTVYFGGRDSHLYAVDAESGKTLWKVHNHGSWVIVSPLVDEQRVYYATSDSKRFVALDKRTGELDFELPTSGWGFSSPVRVGDLIYFGTFGGDLVAVDRRAKRLAWRFLTVAARRDPHDFLSEEGVMDTQKIFQNFDQERMLETQAAMFTMGSILSSPFPYEDRIILATAQGDLYCVK